MNINIRKKIKVVDSVFFTDEVDYLLFRFTEMNDYVDTFIVLEKLTDRFGNDIESVFKKNIEKFEEWKDKIVHVESKLPKKQERDELLLKHNIQIINKSDNEILEILRLKQIDDLITTTHGLNLSFEDVILISEIDEFPVLPPMDTLQTHLSFEPVIFSQTDFLWCKEYIKSERYLGTFCFSYSHFILKKNIHHLVPMSKSYNLKINFTPINFGYKFSLFNSIDDSVEKIYRKNISLDRSDIMNSVIDSRENLVYYDFNTLYKQKSLKKYFGELPKNIDMLDNQKVCRGVAKKHLIVFNIDSLHSITESFDSVSVIKPTENVKSPSTQTLFKNTTHHLIYTPRKQYYDILIKENNFDNFKKMYFLNEIKKIIVDKTPIDIDVFTFYYQGNLISYTWGEIKDKFIYDLLESK